MKLRLFVIAVAALTLSSCCNKNVEIVGSWVEPNPIASDQVQGITLNEDGTASSINMATLRYQSWSREDNVLYLTAESEGSGEPYTMTVKYEIAKLSKDSLVLDGGDYGILRYSRQQ